MATANAGGAAMGVSQAPAHFARPCAATGSRLVGRAGENKNPRPGPSSCAQMQGAMFSPGIFWSGLIVNLCGCEVQALQMNS